MRGKTINIIAGGMAALLLMAGAAGAGEIKRTNYVAAKGYYARAYGDTLPPIGFVGFCARYEEECQPRQVRTARMRLTPARWDLIMQVNTYVNRKVKPVTDQELYNQPEVWDYPSGAGDCEDYVLLKMRYLEELGVPPETMMITVVLDEAGEGHAVLMLRTDSGDFILDNRRDRVMPWYKTGYRYLKRQSQEDPSRWVSLTRDKGKGARFLSGNR